MEVAPDAVEPILAWRAWRVIDFGGQPRLQSMNDLIWQPGKVMEAVCKPSKGKHDPPDERCTCGFYAARDRSHLTSMSYHIYDLESKKDVVVIGQVSMWGRVIPGSQGWKSQFAKPMSVIVPPSRWRHVKPIQETYKLPVKVENTFKKGV